MQCEIYSPDVRSRDSQVSAALIKANVLHLVGLFQLQSLEVLQFAQVPEFDARVLRGRRQVVSVFRETDGRDRARVTREVRHI